MSKCTTCGKPRGLEPLRNHLSINLNIIVPDPDAEHRGIEIINGLLIHLSIGRNGGIDKKTHLCNDCIKIALLHLKSEIDLLIGESAEKNELADMTQRLGRLQLDHKNLMHDHNRMQDRMSDLLSSPDNADAIKMAQWEVVRGHCR